MSKSRSQCELSPQHHIVASAAMKQAASIQESTENGASLSRGFRRRQSGMSSIQLVLMIGLFVLVLTCVLKMVPVYVQSMNVQSVFDGLLEDQLSQDRPFTKSEIRSLITKRLGINQITVLTSKDVDIEKTSAGNVVNAIYEVREPLIANIDVVMKFENSVTLPLAN